MTWAPASHQSLLQEISDTSQLFQIPDGLFLLYPKLSGDSYLSVACQLWKTKRATPSLLCAYLQCGPHENIALPEQGADGGGGSVWQSSFL